jgi:hypothetical protein
MQDAHPAVMSFCTTFMPVPTPPYAFFFFFSLFLFILWNHHGFIYGGKPLLPMPIRKDKRVAVGAIGVCNLQI